MPIKQDSINDDSKISYSPEGTTDLRDFFPEYIVFYEKLKAIVLYLNNNA
jgi:hypothetical protein